MRIVLLISSIVIGASLITGSVGVNAATLAKAHKQGYGKSKKHMASAKQKIPEPPNVWHRISAGLRLPRPDLALAAYNAQLNENKYSYLQSSRAKYSQSLPSTPVKEPSLEPELNPSNAGGESSDPSVKADPIKPAKATPPKDNYTSLGHKLRGDLPSNSVGGCDPKKNKLVKSEPARPLKTRIHTQFNYYPELHKHGNLATQSLAYKAFAENSAAIEQHPCDENDPKKIVRLAQNTPMLPPPSQTDVIQSPQALENEMQLLAAKQQEQAAQRSAKLMGNNERVNKYVDWYGQRQSYLYEVAERARPYLYHIVESIHTHRLPMDLALLPIVESAYQPTAQSPMSAAGLWQFIPSTGADYNLKQDTHYDERLDIVASTEAAASYLTFLNQRFKGDWLLALAAYNCGIGRVEDAIRQNVAAGLDTDYWSLQLPEETQAYVPRLLALSKIFANPAAYKIKLAPIRDEPYFITVKVDRKPDVQLLANKDLKTIAELADVPFEHFTLLNPGYLEPTLPSDRPFNFLMPIANANQLYQRLYMLIKLDDLPEQKNIQTINIPTVKLPSISQLTELGGMDNNSVPFLSLPLTAKPTLESTVTATQTETATPKQQKAKPAQEKYLAVHYVDKGETLLTVAKNFEVSVEAMRTMNKLKRKQGVFLGQRLTIPPKQVVKTIMEQAVNSDILENGQIKTGHSNNNV